MPGITLANAEAQLQLWLTASEKVSTGQEYTIKDRSLTRADLADINTSITYWNRMVNKLSGGRTGMRVRGLTPT